MCVALQGGAKFQEAVFILEEFVDKFGGSPLVFNSLAVANMQMGNFEDAERNLQDALAKVRTVLVGWPVSTRA